MVHINDLGSLGAVAQQAMKREAISLAVARQSRIEARGREGLPQAVINSADALKSRAGISAAKAKAAKQASAKLQTVAKQQAHAARAALQQGDRQKAGVAIVKHLTAMREAVKNEAAVMKNQRTAVAQAKAAQAANEATKLREGVLTAQATGNVAVAANLQARAAIAERKKLLAVEAANTIAKTPLNLPVPAELTEKAISDTAARYAVRVSRRDGAQFQHSRALISILGDMDTDTAGFRNPTAILAEYGGGSVGLVFAGAELGNLAMFDRGIGHLGNWFTDGLKEIGKSVGLDVNAIEKSFNDVGATIGGALKQGEKLVADVSKVISPPKPSAPVPTNTGATIIKKIVSKPPDVPRIPSPTTAPPIKDLMIRPAIPPTPQNVVKPVRSMSMSTSKMLAVAAGVAVVSGAAYAYLR